MALLMNSAKHKNKYYPFYTNFSTSEDKGILPKLLSESSIILIQNLIDTQVNKIIDQYLSQMKVQTFL